MGCDLTGSLGKSCQLTSPHLPRHNFRTLHRITLYSGVKILCVFPKSKNIGLGKLGKWYKWLVYITKRLPHDFPKICPWGSRGEVVGKSLGKTRGSQISLKILAPRGPVSIVTPSILPPSTKATTASIFRQLNFKCSPSLLDDSGPCWRNKS